MLTTAMKFLTFKGPNGAPRIIKVSPSVQGLDAVRRGDRVVMLLTRAVAIDIKPQ